MKWFNDIKEQQGSIRKVRSLFSNESKKLYGVGYTNTYFSQRYLARNIAHATEIKEKENSLTLKIPMRLEQTGLLEVENLLETLVKYEIGDIPGFSVQDAYEGTDSVGADRPFLAEVTNLTTPLFTVDLLLILDNPEITYKDFTIAGSKFTLVKVKHKLEEEEFEQRITLLFGETGYAHLLSFFSDTKLSSRDSKMILELLLDENLSGKVIAGITTFSNSSSTGIFPIEEMIYAYKNIEGDILFNSGTGYQSITKEALEKGTYTMTCTMQNRELGSFDIELRNSKEEIHIMLE